MGDNFFNLFFVGLLALIFGAGAIMFFQMEAETEDTRSINRYMESKGSAPMPRSWRNKVGSGI